ncbi:MAG TPA: hypothetical protein DCS93_31160 [Microscillaceae bacterium]|nr:hypothetical protein [Microscillaceae bacterium]
MNDSDKILQLLRSDDERNVTLGVSLAESASKNGLNTDFVIQELFQHQLPLCFQHGWMLEHITEFYADEYNLRFYYTRNHQQLEHHLELTDEDYAITVCETMEEGMEQMYRLEKLTYLTYYPMFRMEFSFDFAQLHHLKEVHLECLNMADLPAKINQLTQLESLTMTNCRLSRITPEMGGLRKLKKLNISGNGRQEFQENPQLDALYIPLEPLPDTMGDLTNLQELMLDSNGLTELPETIGNLKNLKILSLKNNRVTSLPESIKTLVNLEELHLSWNPLPEQTQAQIRQWLPKCNITFGHLLNQ